MKRTHTERILDEINSAPDGILARWLQPSDRAIAYKLAREGKVEKVKLDSRGYPTAFKPKYR